LGTDDSMMSVISGSFEEEGMAPEQNFQDTDGHSIMARVLSYVSVVAINDRVYDNENSD
jgi:hypothetical protein